MSKLEGSHFIGSVYDIDVAEDKLIVVFDDDSDYETPDQVLFYQINQ